MPFLTILTPTYNRKDKLNNLFDSLKRQSCKDFVWLVIDDGSSDGTESLFDSWIKTLEFPVVYKKKENGGKHTALNYAYQFIDTPLTFIVDSDDYLTDNGVEIIREKYRQYHHETDLCGFSFLRQSATGSLLSTGDNATNGIKESFVEFRINEKRKGDMAEVWYTRCLREFRFPEIKGEKFIGEDIVWIKMSEKYKMRFFSDIVYKADYWSDGLTKNRRKHNIASPQGCVARAEAFLNADIILPVKVKAMLQYIIYGKFAQYKGRTEFKQLNRINKVLYIMLYIPAMVIFLSWKKRYRVES